VVGRNKTEAGREGTDSKATDRESRVGVYKDQYERIEGKLT
jgi:hypothetical protein